MTSKSLFRVLERLNRQQQLLERLSRRQYDPHIVELCLAFGLKDWQELINRQRVADLDAFLSVNGVAVVRRQENEEHGAVELGCVRANNGHDIRWIDRDLLNSPEYQQAHTLEVEMKGLGRPPFVVVDGQGKEKELDSRDALLEYFRDQGRKGLFIQRYKGLGEMNPEQLWETTMDPLTRTMLRVRVEDAEEADQIFSTLMGDQVEPRREFITAHAQEVQSLDI